VGDRARNSDRRHRNLVGERPQALEQHAGGASVAQPGGDVRPGEHRARPERIRGNRGKAVGSGAGQEGGGLPGAVCPTQRERPQRIEDVEGREPLDRLAMKSIA
jgi:hypothetical protein